MSYLVAKINYMFDVRQPDGSSGIITTKPDPAPPVEVPLERVEAQICELAGHLAAATAGS